MNNNAVRYNDPTGHMCSDPEDPTPGCDGGMGTGSTGVSTSSGGGKKVDAKKVSPSLDDMQNADHNATNGVSCPENLGFNSQCQVLSASEMEKYYQNVSNVSLAAGFIGLGASIVAIASTQIGTGVAVVGFVALVIPVVGIPVGGALMTAGYGIATTGAAASGVVGLASAVVSVETALLGSAIDSAGARQTGGTVTTSNYIVFQTTTITTKTKSEWSLSFTPVTPAILPIQQLWSAILGG